MVRVARTFPLTRDVGRSLTRAIRRPDVENDAAVRSVGSDVVSALTECKPPLKNRGLGASSDMHDSVGVQQTRIAAIEDREIHGWL